MSPSTVKLPLTVTLPEYVPSLNAPVVDAVIPPVMLIDPVPVILFEFKSNAPPSCGDVSSTTFNIPVSVSVSSATTQVVPLYFIILPFEAPDVSTSVSSPNVSFD